MNSVIRGGEPAAALLLLDIGNSTAHCGIWSANAVRAHRRIPHADSDALEQTLSEFRDALGQSRACVACAVAEGHFGRIRSAVESICRQPLLRIGVEVPLPLEVAVEAPAGVGTDRLCCAAAAYHIEEAACTVADFGTALTVDSVDDAGRFIGGAILPGLELQAAALAEFTEKLPQAPIDLPSGPLGQDTVQAIQSGILYGSVGAVREITERVASQLGRWPTLYFTGGAAELAARATDIVDRVVPDLCLRGVALSYYKSLVQETGT